MGAGAFAIGLALYQVLTPGSPVATYETVSDFVREGLFLGYLVFSIAAVLVARRADRLPGAGPVLVALGYGLLAFGVGAGFVLMEDPQWFAALGMPGNLLAGIGFVT